MFQRDLLEINKRSTRCDPDIIQAELMGSLDRKWLITTNFILGFMTALRVYI